MLFFPFYKERCTEEVGFFFILVVMGEDNSPPNRKTDKNGNIVIINNKNCTLGDGNKWNNTASSTYFKKKNW